jgi:hypothetical protein
MDVTAKGGTPFNVLARNSSPNFLSNKQLVDRITQKKGGEDPPSLATLSTNFHPKRTKSLRSAKEVPARITKATKIATPHASSLQRASRVTRALPPSKQSPCQTNSCPHGAFCRDFQTNMARFYQLQDIQSTIAALKRSARSDSYSFHRIFDVLTRHSYHNRQLLNDLKSI